MSAALAYYTVFSIAPLLLLTISIAGLVFGSDAVEGRIVTELGSLVGPSSAATIQSMIKAAYRPGGSVIASAVSIITLLIGAIGVLWELKSALNQIWRTAAPGGMKEIVKRNLVLLAMMLGIG